MAVSRMIAFDPFTPEDYKAMFKKHSWTDRSEVDIDQYLTPDERLNMCEYEKDRYRNIKKNYDVMVDMGLPAKKPYFMLKNRPKFLQPIDESSDSDGDWVPAKNKPRAKKPIIAGWKPPVRKAESTSSKLSAKVKPVRPKSKQKSKGKAAKAEVSKKKTRWDSTKVVLQDPVLTDSDDDEDFDGFSAADVEQSAARRDEVVPRNEEILAAIEAGTYDFGLSDDEEEESDSPNSEEAEVAQDSVIETLPDKPAAADKPGRYPRRSITRKVYTEPEVPKDDDYLYCEECDHDYEGDCPVHGPLLIIHDTEVANDGSDPDRADHSLPKGLVVRKSQIPLAGDGVWCEKRVPKGARFGPYEGIKEDDMEEAHKSGYCWVIYADGQRVSHYVDAGDKSQANWLRYVNCARNEGEQNLLAYQFHGEVYYRTVQEILPGQELLVWYGDEYGRELGLLGEEGKEQQGGKPAQLGQGALQKLFHDAGFEVWVCDVCSRVYPSETWRDRHKRTHGDRTGSKRHACTQCSYSTDISSHYNRHLVTHSGVRPFTCTVCGKAFSQSQHLTTHQRVHSGDKPYPCPVCGKRFNMSGSLQRHSRIHTGGTPYSCPLCEYACTQSHHLTTHMRTHTGEKPHGCPTCTQAFSTASNLTVHMRTHTGEKPHVCTTCGEAFSHSQSLTHHTYTHTGRWPHPCSLCTKGFAAPSELRKHTQRSHSQ